MAAKHFMVYYKKGTGTYIVTEPMPWARENREYFSNFSFTDSSHPTPVIIERWLIENRAFQKVVNTDSIVVVQNLDPNLDL